MAKIYLDQASTSYPKAPSVAQAVYDYLNGSAVNVNRGGYQAAYSVEEQIFETRLFPLWNTMRSCVRWYSLPGMESLLTVFHALRTVLFL